MEKHNEEWLLSKGWEKTEGFVIDKDVMDENFEGDIFYIESLEDMEGITKCFYYHSEEFPEYATHDLDEAIKYYEDSLIV